MNKPTGRLMALSMASLAALLLSLAPTTPASADARGYDYWYGQTVNGHSIPSGVLEHFIEGDGLRVTSDQAGALPVGRLCSWRIDFRYYDVNNVVYKTSNGTTRGCSEGGYREYRPGTLRAGRACARVYSYNKVIAQQCHGIYP